MPVVATPELGIPFPFDTTPEELQDFRAKARAMLATLNELESQGVKVDVSDEDRKVSHEILASEEMPQPKDLTPGTIKHLNTILSEYDREVFDVHRRLRAYVTNKLILDSSDPDPKTRLKALELLGKVSGVGLFSDRVDINVTHRTVKDIETELRKTLELYDVEYSVVPATKSVSLADIDLDSELGNGRNTAS
jgi:hypothetical protein